MLTQAERERINDEIAHLAEAAKKCVSGSEHYRATVILRATHLPDGDVIVTEDSRDEVLAVVENHWP